MHYGVGDFRRLFVLVEKFTAVACTWVVGQVFFHIEPAAVLLEPTNLFGDGKIRATSPEVAYHHRPIFDG